VREESRLRVFENRVLRRIFGPRRYDATGEWRKLHNEELNVLYCLPNIFRVIKSRRIRWAGHLAHMVVRERIIQGFVRKQEGKTPLFRVRRRWVDIKINIHALGCVGMD